VFLTALQRARVSHRLQSVQSDESRVAPLYIAGMLRALPFQAIGDIARHGLELHVYCPSCYSTRRLVDLERWADRCSATARFRCTGTRNNGAPCRVIGMPVIRPAELLPVGGPVSDALGGLPLRRDYPTTSKFGAFKPSRALASSSEVTTTR